MSDAAGLAHDAGNLLGALGLYSQLLARPGVLREEHRHYADELQMLSGRSRELIDRLLNPSTTQRKAAGRQEHRALSPGDKAHPEGVAAVALPEVIERCRGLLNTIARRAVAVAYEAGAATPVAVPAEMLERILINLTKNAAEATEGEGAILLRVTCRPATGDRESVGHAGQRIVLTVEDRGRGMSVATVKRLLEPRATERPTGPHGIGFRVVRELVGATGGQLRLESRSEGEAHGTTVEVAWAVAAAATEAEATPTFNSGDTADPDRASHYVPTSFSERHGLLQMTGQRALAERVETTCDVRLAGFDVAGRAVC